jgi:hypothetical protein
METKNSTLEQVLETIDDFAPDELDLIEKRLASAREKKNGGARVAATRDIFAITFDEYLAMSDEERDALQLEAYEKYTKWIDEELRQRQARWMLVCGGTVIESSPTLRNYPRDEKLRAVGEQYGLIPFVFAAQPLIEEFRRANVHFHLGRPFHYHFVPVLIGVVTEAGKMISGVIETLCVRDWAKSPFRSVNHDRQALVGMNALMELPLQIKLDGRRRVTHVLDD